MDDKTVAEFAAALRRDLSEILTTVDSMLTKLATLEAHARLGGNGGELDSVGELWQELSEHNKSSMTNLESLRSCEIVSVECSPEDVGTVNITESSESSGCLSPPSECDSLLFSDISPLMAVEEMDDDFDSCCGGEQEHWVASVPENNHETCVFSPCKECVAEDACGHHERMSVSCVTVAESATVPHEPVASNISESGFKRRLLWFVNKLFPNQQKFDPDDPFILQTLYDMGFTDEKQNSKILHECNGVIPRVLDSLLESTDSP